MLPLSKTPEYHAWLNARHRCHNPNHASYKDYGARGITMWRGWFQNYTRFIADVGLRPSSKHTLERLDNDKGYYPGNVVWATRRQQSLNTRPKRPAKSLTQTQITAIRMLHGLMAQRDIADAFGISQPRVSHVTAGLPFVRVSYTNQKPMWVNV